MCHVLEGCGLVQPHVLEGCEVVQPHVSKRLWIGATSCYGRLLLELAFRIEYRDPQPHVMEGCCWN
jgi:hypothetical protein